MEMLITANASVLAAYGDARNLIIYNYTFRLSVTDVLCQAVSVVDYHNYYHNNSEVLDHPCGIALSELLSAPDKHAYRTHILT